MWCLPLDMLGDQIDVALAISLHAPTNDLRDEIVPVNKKYPIEEFLAGVRRYLSKSNANQGKVTVEYVMLNGINDSMDQAHQLAKVLKDTPSKINLIPFQPLPWLTLYLFEQLSHRQVRQSPYGVWLLLWLCEKPEGMILTLHVVNWWAMWLTEPKEC